MIVQNNFIKAGRKNRPSSRTVRRIVLCETNNVCRCADALAYAAYLDSDFARESWHYTVDDKRGICHLPDGERCFAPRAVRDKIVVKLCVNEGGNFSRTLQNATELVALLLRKYELGIECVRFGKKGSKWLRDKWRRERFLRQVYMIALSEEHEVCRLEQLPGKFYLLTWERSEVPTEKKEDYCFKGVKRDGRVYCGAAVGLRGCLDCRGRGSGDCAAGKTRHKSATAD